tara:strand:- start:2267 stop:2629 length:363 start_codon:yes stop_codon:yes gene_type:complete
MPAGSCWQSKSFLYGKSIKEAVDKLQEHIDRVGIFKQKRPRTSDQAARFFYCKWAKPGEVCFLSGKSCAQRHSKAKARLESLDAEGASPVEYEIAGCRACGECEFGALRVELLKNKRRKK